MNFIFLITLIVLCAVFEVESGDYLIRDGINYYVSYPEVGNWFEALRFCAYNQMYLIDVQSFIENKRILSIINETVTKYNNPNINFWTSGNDIGHNMDFVWATSGKRIVWHYFDRGQPDNNFFNMEHCVHYWPYAKIKYRWNDRICENSIPYICRNKLDEPLIDAKDKVGWINVDVN